MDFQRMKERKKLADRQRYFVSQGKPLAFGAGIELEAPFGNGCSSHKLVDIGGGPLRIIDTEIGKIVEQELFLGNQNGREGVVPVLRVFGSFVGEIVPDEDRTFGGLVLERKIEISPLSKTPRTRHIITEKILRVRREPWQALLVSKLIGEKGHRGLMFFDLLEVFKLEIALRERAREEERSRNG